MRDLRGRKKKRRRGQGEKQGTWKGIQEAKGGVSTGDEMGNKDLKIKRR